MVGMGELTGSVVALIGTWLASIPPVAGKDEPVHFIEFISSASFCRMDALDEFIDLLGFLGHAGNGVKLMTYRRMRRTRSKFRQPCFYQLAQCCAALTVVRLGRRLVETAIAKETHEDFLAAGFRRPCFHHPAQGCAALMGCEGQT